jgi:hypothetical protein
MPVQGEIMSETLAEQEPSLICRHTTTANRLSVGQISLRQPAAEAETDKGPHRALAAWTWGHCARPELYLRLLEPRREGVHRPRRQGDGGRVCPPRLRNGYRKSRMRRCRRKQKGTASASFDVGVMNGIERSHLGADVTDPTPDLDARMADATQAMRDKHVEHEQQIALRRWHARKSEQDAGCE